MLCVIRTLVNLIFHFWKWKWKALKSHCYYLHLRLNTIWNIVFASDVPSTPGKPLIMSFSSRTVNLSWAPPLDTHNAPVLEYVIRQRKGEDSSWETTRQALEKLWARSITRAQQFGGFSDQAFWWISTPPPFPWFSYILYEICRMFLRTEFPVA
jgi:hypothetical protein